MKEILLLLVGGTICTSLSDRGTLAVSEKAGSLLVNNFFSSDSPFTDEVHFDLTENLFLLSENMTVPQWNRIYSVFLSYTEKKHYDGVIFAHGTDTLAYSAALFSLLCADTDIPLFFVSGNRRLDAEGTNGNANFRCAVESICRGISPHVYVPYRNPSDGRMYLHLGSRLQQCANYSEDFFSVGALLLPDSSETAFRQVAKEITDFYPRSPLPAPAAALKTIKVISDCVLLLSPYVGINYEAYRYELYRAVLHGTYHSGTACAGSESSYDRNSVLRMLDCCAEKGVDCYFSPSRVTGEIYDTVRIIADHEVADRKPTFLYGMTNEMSYCKLLLAYSLFADKDKIDAFLHTEIHHEFIYA